MRLKVPILVLLILCFIVSISYCSEFVPPKVQQNFRINPTDRNLNHHELDEDTTIYFFDFETGEDWRAIDFTAPGDHWIVSDYEAYEDGTSWWCGDPEIPGYFDGWLQFLNSPTLDLTNAGDGLVLEFMMRYGFEFGDPQNEDFDGWDGCNVWISTDDGANWSVLENPSVPYEETSLYSFYLRGMESGIPGWSGFSDGWEACSFDLSAYAGQAQVKIRFAVATDNGTNSENNTDWVSFIVDDIDLHDNDTSYLQNNAEDVAIPSDMEPQHQAGGANVNFTLQTEQYHSADHAWQCENGSDIFSRLISPPFEVPSADFRTFISYWVYCDLPDSDGDDDGTLEDFYWIEVLDEDGHYELVGYDYGYNGSEAGWVERTTALYNSEPTEFIDISNWAEQTIRIAFRTFSDDNDDGGTGSGLYIDDVSIIQSTGWDYDMEISPMYFPFPVTVGRLVPATVTFANKGNYDAEFIGIWYEDPGVGAYTTYAIGRHTLLMDSSQTFFVDYDYGDEVDGYMPSAEGIINIYGRAHFQNDENTLNNETERIDIDVRPMGTYELGYDNRTPDLTTSRFGVGEGPITHFYLPEDFNGYNINTLRVLWNGDLNDPEDPNAPGNTDVDVHILAGGDTPGAEIWTSTYNVTPEQTMDNWMEVDVSDVTELQNLTTDFWVWWEVTQNHAYPHIVFSERLWGDGHAYDFDGTDLSDADADWMIRVVGTAELIEGVDDQETELPLEFALEQPYPNPFNPSTNLTYKLAKSTQVNISVYNVMGQQVALLVDQVKAAGSHQATWNAEGFSTGLYFVKMETASFNAVQKMMLIK